MAQGIPVFGVATNASGTPISGATVAVHRAGTLTDITIYTDAALTVAAANPLSANSDGTFLFYGAAGQAIRLRITIPGGTTRDVDNIHLHSRGSSMTRGLVGINNPATPLTQFDLSADAVTLQDADLNSIVRGNTGVLTNNTSTAGPAANGRDQAAVFGASTWLHFYFIWHPSSLTLATISSLTAPPTGPVLPTGYTSWAYAGAVRFNGASTLVETRFRGKTAHYRAYQQPLVNGNSSFETPVSVATFVPPNAADFFLFQAYAQDTGAASFPRVRVVSAVDFWSPGTNITSAISPGPHLVMPNLGQNFYYLWSATPAGNGISLYLTGYTMPNGD